jgi:cytochrome P450
LMRQATSRNDLPIIKGNIAAIAKSLVAEAAPSGQIDVVGGLSRVAAMRLCGFYFDTPGDHEPTMMRWMRAIFRQIFLNLANDPNMAEHAHDASAGLTAYLDARILKRKTEISAGQAVPDTFLCRLLKLQSTAANPFADEVIRRILGGTIVGTVDTNSKAVAQAIDVLLDRPAELRTAHQAALDNDDGLFASYIFEALRFNPQNPFLIRHCEQDYTLAAGTPRETTVHKGSLVIAGTEIAMFDPDVFVDPNSFRVDRPPDKYIHFGHGLHSCFGKHIGQAVIPAIAKELLLCKGLHRAPGADGQIVYDGAFPDRFVVEFDR